MTRRIMGKLAFVTLRDDSGTIQLYFDKSRVKGGADTMKARAASLFVCMLP
jgi:lysyl-tRNA synthetase class II